MILGNLSTTIEIDVKESELHVSLMTRTKIDPNVILLQVSITQDFVSLYIQTVFTIKIDDHHSSKAQASK